MFSKKHRIPRESVKKVISDGQKGYSELFLFKKLKNNLNYNRYTVVVSKKVSKNAVERNKIKRKVKNAVKFIVKEKKDLTQQGVDVVILTSPTIKKATFQEILKTLRDKKVL